MLARALPVLLLVALALAGCSDGKKGGDGTGPGDDETKGLPMLHGYVVDPTIAPLEGVTVKVLDSNATTATDEGGYFGFDELPTETFLVIVASKPGYIPSSKQVTLVPDTPVRLNFSLELEPVKAATREVLKFEGFLGCEVAVLGPSGNNSYNCNPGIPGVGESLDIHDFSVGPDLAGAVIEIYWDPFTPAAEILGSHLETLELGQLNVALGDQIGASPLRMSVAQSIAEKYYPQGGIMRLSMYPASDGKQTEAGIGYSVAFQQAFTAYISLFYVEPPPAGYTIDP